MIEFEREIIVMFWEFEILDEGVVKQFVTQLKDQQN